MLIGMAMLLAPAAVFLITLPLSAKLRPGIRKVYRVLGAVIVFGGSAASIYFAFYGGDQGGIAAYFLQSGVIAGYVLLSAGLVGLNGLLRVNRADEAAPGNSDGMT